MYKDLSEFDQGQIVIAKGLGQRISRTAAPHHTTRGLVETVP